MNAAWRRNLAQGYDAVEHVFGVITPLASALSLLDAFGLLGWTWLLLFWLSCGHWVLYFYGAYPIVRHRPFVRGLFAFGVGLLFPVWLLARHRTRGLP